MDRENVEERNAQAEQKKMRKSLTAIDQQYEAQESVPTRIHIIGTGSIGKLVAHALRSGSNPPPVSLIFHRSSLFKAWEASKRIITVEDGGSTSSTSGFDGELAQWELRQHGQVLDKDTSDAYATAERTGLQPHEAARLLSDQRKRNEHQISGPRSAHETSSVEEENQEGAVQDEPIHNLIITTKAIRTIPALSAIKHRLSRDSTICFLQNGMGIIDDVNALVFPDEATRPNYVQGIITHGANVPPQKAREDPFYVVHAGHGTIALGLLPRNPLNQTSDPATTTTTNNNNDNNNTDVDVDECPPSTRYILRALTRSPTLCAVAFTPLELFQQQLEKLAVNSVLNPLTVLLDQRNGALLYNFALTRTMRLMLAETSRVIRSLPELANLPTAEQRFGPERLETLVVGVAHRTKENISSMLADVREGRKTEVGYINGYIVRRGEELGIKCVVNYAMMQTVIGKCLMVQREVAEEVPMDDGTAAGVVNPE